VFDHGVKATGNGANFAHFCVSNTTQGYREQRRQLIFLLLLIFVSALQSQTLCYY